MISKIIEDFRKIGSYTEQFLKDLEKGLKKSSYTTHVTKSFRKEN